MGGEGTSIPVQLVSEHLRGWRCQRGDGFRALRKEADSLRLGVYGMRWMGCAVCAAALLAAGVRVEAQQAPQGKSAPIMVTTGSPSISKTPSTATTSPASSTAEAKQGPSLPD